MNEVECESIWGIPSRTADGSLDVAGIRKSMERMADSGVRDKIVIHAKEAAFILDAASREFSTVGSLILPSEEIRGSVGAGDAFCAGCLYAFYHGYADTAALEFASGAAACSLFAANAVDGMRSRNEIMELCKKYERRTV
jgi:sugar/nucleoside kinase (ribokinase family)